MIEEKEYTMRKSYSKHELSGTGTVHAVYGTSYSTWTAQQTNNAFAAAKRIQAKQKRTIN